jgi:hypothetical protein
MLRAIGAPEAKHLFTLTLPIGGVDLARVRVRAGVRVQVRVGGWG